MATVATLLTAEQFARNEFGFWAELVHGEVEQVTRPEVQHRLVCASLVFAPGRWSRPRNSGFVVSNEAGVVTERDPDTVHGPDVMSVPMERRPGDRMLTGIDLLPSFVVEVVSPSDRWRRMLKKVGESLERGVSEVWLIESPKKRLHRCRLDETPIQLHEQDTLESEPVLPGFSCQAAESFHGL